MLRSYLAAAWRAARRDRFYALLNLLGLALGFAVVILISLYVRDEVTFNRFLPGYQDAYRIQLTIAETGERPKTWAATPERMAAELKLDFPEIAYIARVATQKVGLRHGDVEAGESIEWVDRDFLAVLPYKLLQGDPATALAQPDSIVLTRRLAMKYFGTIDCVGQMLDVNRTHPIRVTAVAEDPPSNATLKFAALLSGNTPYGKLVALDAAPPVMGELNLTLTTYARLRPGTDPARLADRIAAFGLARYPNADGTKPLFASLVLKSFADVHLHPYDGDTNEPDDRVQSLYAVAATGVLILLLAGINFVNLVTARATRRAVEVGVRKGFGAMRGQLMVQFMGESIGYALVGMLLGVGLAEMFLPTLNAFLDRQIAFDFWRDPSLAAAPVLISVLLGAVAGLYPAVILSGFPPAAVLKSRSGGSLGGGRLRIALVVFQFTVTIALLISTIVIYRQISFATSEALRFDKDLILTLDLTGMPQHPTPDGLDQREAGPVEALRTQLAAVPGVQAIAATFVVPLLTQSFVLDFGRPDQIGGPSVNLTIQPVDFGYLDLYRIPLIAGRDFSRDLVDDKAAPEDKSRLTSTIINESAVRALGFGDPQQALGQDVQSRDPGFPERRYRIVGVVPDFPLESVRTPVPPSIFIIDPDLFNVLNMKLSGADLSETLRGVDAVWRTFAPEQPISRIFLDDRIAGLYVAVNREGQLFATFAGFAVVIGCLGLVGLSAYTAERRTKEIGIRKALGASTFDVARLLILQFVRPVVLANLLAWPVAWWFMRGWLDGFAYRIDLGPSPFLAAGVGAVAIAVGTTAFHALQVARSKPVAALRYE